MKVILPYVDCRPSGYGTRMFIAGYIEDGDPDDTRLVEERFQGVKAFFCEHEAWNYSQGYVDGMHHSPRKEEGK